MKLLQSGAAAFGRYLFNPQEYSNGINGFRSVKFYFVFAAYLCAFLVFAHDPFFHEKGAFVYQQGIVTLLLAFVAVAAFNWELSLFGKSAGANLLLQILMAFPFTLLIARITASPSVPPEPKSLAGRVLTYLKDLTNTTVGDLFSVIPAWLTDLFSNWKISLMFVLLLFFLCFRSLKIKFAAVICLLLVPFFTTVQEGNLEYLLCGFLLFAAGLSMQYCRYDRIVYFENIVKKINASGSADELFLAVLMRVMTQLREKEKISEANLFQIVKAEYSLLRDYSDAELRIIAGEISKRMVYEYNLVYLKGSSDGLFLVPEPLLFCYDNLLCAVAVFPRMVLSVLFALIWIVLPVDLIPDAIPFFGALDDVTVAVLSGIVLKNSVEKH